MEKQLHLIVHGRVQGVFYRLNAQHAAKKYYLTGYVKNLDKGSVEIVAEGEEEDLKQFLRWCKKGPLLAKVEDIDISWKKYSGEFPDFGVRY